MGRRVVDMGRGMVVWGGGMGGMERGGIWWSGEEGRVVVGIFRRT